MEYNSYYQDEDSQQVLTSPTDDVYGLSPWKHLVKNEIADAEEVLSQPERGIAGFVSKLYQCLDEPDEGQKYARWCKHNGIDMFVIDCIPKFTEIVLPRLFKHCKFASFVRQLNIYGFQRGTDARKSKDSKDKESCRWHHIYFRPGRRDLFHLIRRKTPRYSRNRKRQKPGEEDPETILNIGSGDEESDHNSTRHTPSPILLPQQTTIEYDVPPTIDFDRLFVQTTVTANPYNDNTFNDNSAFLLLAPTNNDRVQTPTTPTTATTEDELCSQIVELRKGYTRMCKILTEEINKAFNVIHTQRARIELLENTLQQNYLSNTSLQFLQPATTSMIYNNNPQDSSSFYTPTTTTTTTAMFNHPNETSPISPFPQDHH